jgi:hypothetical protein
LAYGEKVTGQSRRLHKEELHALYCLPNIIRVIKSRRMRWVRNVARMAERRCAYRVCCGGVREGDHFEDIGVDGRIILKSKFKKFDEDMN